MHTDTVVLDPPLPDAVPADAPDGWELLPAGVTRRLRVNRLWVLRPENPSLRPFLLWEPGSPGAWALPVGCAEVRILGPAEMMTAVGGASVAAWLQTDAALLVRR